MHAINAYLSALIKIQAHISQTVIRKQLLIFFFFCTLKGNDTLEFQ